MFYLNLAIDQKFTRLRCQHVAVLLVVFLIAILSVGCSKQPSTTSDDAQSLEQIDAQLMASGQWRDPDTGLIWMRCSIGQTWTGKTCIGDLLSLNWQDAQDYVVQFTNADGGFAGHSDWRVPSIDELVTLRRCSTGWERRIESRLTPEGRRDVAVGPETMTLPSGSSIPIACAEFLATPHLDQRVFPNNTHTHDDDEDYDDENHGGIYWYWSSTPYTRLSGSYGGQGEPDAWGVVFDFGYVSPNDSESLGGHSYGSGLVRVVRAGQSVSEASAPVEVAATSAEPVASEAYSLRPITSAEPAVSVEAAATSAQPVASKVYSPRPLATDSQANQSLLTSGQWRDPATGLIWMRCSIGQTWTGSTCSGTPIELNWQDANDYFQLFNQDGFAGKKNWRLPKIEELVTIRRCSNGWEQRIIDSRLTPEGRRGVAVGPKTITLPSGSSVPEACTEESREPMVDTQIFKNTPAGWYWSSSPYADDVNSAWMVGFHHGYASDGYKNSNYYVRAVRAGQ